MRQFENQIFVALEEKVVNGKKDVQSFAALDAKKLWELNQRGYGIYVTANSFDGRRIKEKIIKLNAIVGDLDIAKDEDQLPGDVLEQRKNLLIEKLNQYCPPSWMVITKNGVQPWYFLDEDRTDEKTLETYVGVMSGLIDLSKEFGGCGDETKDVTRLWRMPGYLHQKSNPFPVTEVSGNGHVWALGDLKEFFWRETKTIQKRALHHTVSDNPLWREMEKIDIRDIVIRVGAQLGHKIEFGKDGHLILNGERRGTFIGTGGQFIATQSSVFPIKGNRVTVVANMFKCSNGEAVRWICENFDSDPRLKRYGRKN